MKKLFNKTDLPKVILTALLILFAVFCIDIIIVNQPGNMFIYLWGGVLQIIKTIFYALIIAYIMSPIMNFFHFKVFKFVQKKRDYSVIRKLLALFCTFLIFFSLLTAIVWIAVPQALNNIESLGGVFQGYYNSADAYIESLKATSPMFGKIYGVLVQSDGNLGDLIANALNYASDALFGASEYIITFITNFVNEVKTIFMGILLSIYFVYFKELLVSQISRFGKAFLPDKVYSYTSHIIDDIDIKFAKFLRGKAFDSTIVGVILYVTYKIVGIPYAEILAIIGGVMNMIPSFGPIIASFVCGFILLITAPDMLLLYIAIVCIVGLIDTQFIEPRLLGESLGLKPVWIILSIIIMSALFGLFGMFFGVPIFAVIYTLVKEAVDARIAKREAKESTVAAAPESESAPSDEGTDTDKEKENASSGDVTENN